MSDGRFDTATPSRLALVVAVLLSLVFDSVAAWVNVCVCVWQDQDQEKDQGRRHPTLSEGLTLLRRIGDQGFTGPVVAPMVILP
jgi:hypothetical protein